MPICIAGMGRSGTSLCTQLLFRAGVYLGPEADLLPADADNRDGYWENINFITINDELLHIAGGAWDFPPSVSGLVDASALDDSKARARALIGQFAAHPLWGWKDPRNSLTAPFWRELLPDLQFVICVRNPLEVARSLRNQRGFSLALSLHLWQEYNTRLLASVPPEQRTFTHFAAYFDDPERELARVLAALAISAPETAVAQAGSRVAADFRSTQFTLHDLTREGVPREVVDLYARLCREAEWTDPDPPLRHREITAKDGTDLWRSVSHPDSVQLTAQQHLVSVERDRDNLRAYLQDVERDRAGMRQHLTDLTAHLEAVERDRTNLRAHLADVEQDRTNLRTYLADVEQDRTNVRTYLQGVQQDCMNLREHLRAVEQDRTGIREYLAGVLTHLADVEQDRTNIQEYLEGVLAHLHDVEQDRTKLHEHLQAVEEDRTNLRAHLEEAEQDRTNLRAYLTGTRVYLEQVEQAHAQLSTHADQLQREYDQVRAQATEMAEPLAATQATTAAQEQEIAHFRQEVATLHAQITRLESTWPRRLLRRLRHPR